MASCINKSSAEFIKLLKDTGFNEIKLSGKIKSWRRETGRSEDFPRLEDIKPDIVPDIENTNSSMRFNTSLQKEGSAQYAYEVNEGITYYFFEYFFNSGKGLSQFINGDLQVLIPEAYKYAKEQLEKLDNSDLRFALDRWNEAKVLHNEFLSNFKLQSEDYRDESDNIEEVESGGLRTDWFNKFAETSGIKSASNITRLLIATMPNIKYNKDGSREQVKNSLGLPKLVDFGKTFNLFANKLANNLTINEMAETLDKMSKDGINEATTLIQRTFIEGKLDSVDKYHTLLPFAQAMAKYRNNYIISQMMPDGTIKEINATNQSLEFSIVKEWKNNEEKSRNNNTEYFIISNEEDNKITYDINRFRSEFGKKEGDKYINNIQTINQAKRFLKILGIEFSGEENRNNGIDDIIINKAKKIADNIIRQENGSRLFQNMEDHNSKEDLETLINIQKILTPYEYIENMIFIKGGKKMYANSLFSFFTRTIVKVNKTTSENFDKMFPHLVSDPYSRNSKLVQLLKEGKLEIEESVLVENKTENKQEEYNKLSEGDRFRLVFEKYKNNEYALLRPESNKQEHFIKLPELIDTKDQEAIKQRLIDYIEDELALINAGYEIDGLKDNGILLSIIRKDIREQIIEDYKKDNYSFKDNKDFKDIILADILNHIDERTKDLANKFYNYGLVTFEKDKVSSNLLGLKNGITKDNFKASVKNMFIKNMIAGIEQTKLFSGSPTFYGSPDKYFKRLGQLVGTKDMSFSDPQVNDFLDLISTTGQKLAQNEAVDTDVETDQLFDSKGNITDKYDNNMSVVNISVMDDVIAYSDRFDKEKLDKEEKELYHKMTEDDGIGFITLDGARRLLVRNGEWKFTMKEHEGKYQWEIQNALGIPEDQMVYIDPISGDKVPLKVNKDFVFNSLKLQGFGPLAFNVFIPSNEKASFIILSPSITEGKNMDEIRKEMTYRGFEILITASGKKVGAPKIKHKPYKDDGTVNDLITSYQQISVENISVQLKTGNKFKKNVTTGTQMMMHIIGDIIDNGGSKDGFPDAKELVDEFINLNNERIELGAEILKEQFGIIREGDGYRVTNGERLRKLIKDEIDRRELPYNTLDGLNRIIDTQSFNIDTIINRKDIEYILNSLADKEIFRQKRNGRSPFQIPSTFFENDVREFVVFDKNGDVVEITKDISGYDKTKFTFKVTSNFLKFYKNENGVITKMQVGIPSYIEGIGNTSKIDDKRLLNLIGFRIPTQGLASIESIEPIFLPKEYGDTILLPTEIVAKVGTDYDIDKMNIYIPNFYYGIDGKPVYLDKYSKYEDYAAAERSRVVSNILNNISKKLELTPFIRQNLNEIIGELNITKGVFFEEVLAELTNRKETIKGKNVESYDKLVATLQQLILEKADLNEYGFSENQFKKLIVENELTELMTKLIIHPSNWLNLITPISSHDLVKLSNENKEGSIMAKFFDIVDFGKQIDQHQQFIEGDEAIGRTALGSKFHIFSQQNKFFFKPKYKDSSGTEKDSILNLPHNKTEEGNISLANLINQAKESISKILKQFVNTAVDNPTELALKKLNAGLDTINTWLFLTMAGVPIRTIKDFMNQPVILKYLENKKKNESHIVSIAGNPKSRLKIAGETMLSFNSKMVDNKGKLIIKPSNNMLSMNDLLSIDEKGIRSTKVYKDQYQILVDYLRYEEMAGHIVSAQQALSYDNNSIGKNPAETLLKIINTKKQIEENAVGNLGKALNNEKSYESIYYNQAQETLEILKSFSPKVLKATTVFREIERFVIKINDKRGLSTDDKVRLIDKFRDDLITKIMLTQWSNISGKRIAPIISQLERLTRSTGTNLSVGDKIKLIQDVIKRGNEDINKLKSNEIDFYEKFKNDPFINTVIVPINKYEGDNVKFPNINTTRLEGNNIIEAIEQGVKKGVDNFYTDIYKLSILQTGHQNSPLSIKKFLPDKYYGELMQNMLNDLSEETLHEIITPYQIGQEEISLFEWEFKIMNYNDSNLVPYMDMDVDIGDIIQQPRLLDKYKKYYKADGSINKEKLQTEVRDKGINPYSATPRLFVVTADGKKLIKLGSLANLPMPIKDLRNEASLNIYGTNELKIITDQIVEEISKKNEIEEKIYCKNN